MDSLVDPVEDPPPDRVALEAPGNPPATYRHRDFAETVWRTGNYFRRLGAHEDATVGVVPHVSAAVPLAVFGAALNGATVRLDPPPDVDANLLVAPGDRIESFDLPPGAQRVAHTVPVDDPSVHSFGQGVPGENPFFPPDRVFEEAAAIEDGERHFDRAAIVDHVEWLSDRVSPSDVVVNRTPLEDARAIVAGIFLPLDAGASVRIPPENGDAEPGTVAIVSESDGVPEDETIPLDTVRTR